MFPSSERRFLKINYLTIISLFLVILAGGVVRSTGSGMGCPDWPRCFGKVIPPTHASQLPENYKEHFVEGRVQKNERFAGYLDILGFGHLAERIRTDESILVPEEFNAAKTWTEYVNRIIGVITGFLLILSALFSLTYLKSRKRIFFLSFLNVFLVGFQGWFGSIVVSTNLLAWTITLHMILALLIVAISIYTYFQAKTLRDRSVLPSRSAGPVRFFAVVTLLISIVQIVIGTDVREQVDAISSTMPDLSRSEWVSKLDTFFNIHRDLAILVVFSNLILFFLVRSRYVVNSYQFKYMLYVAVLIVLQIITGIILAYFSLPAAMQTTHLMLACLMFGAQYYLLLLLGRNKLYKRR